MITGHTRVIAVIGDPIASARAPQSLTEAIARDGRDAVIVPAGIPAASLEPFVRAARGWTNLAGLVVTMPHKAAIARLVDDLGVAARASGAVNVVRRLPDGRLAGEQLDGEGFAVSLRAAGIGVAGSRILILGAGGVARPIAYALAAEGPARLRIANRTRAKAEELVAGLVHAFPGLDVAVGDAREAAEADLLVNATSVGSAASPGLPLDPDLIRAGSVVADVVASPERTQLLEAAESRGARIHSGLRMQEAQLESILGLLL